jgi:TetR/AcrR family transcriptional repressor of nem operon
MPYTPAHKAETRARIVDSARVLFNGRGFDQVSIDDIMEHAGLTRGGFYNHFSSKDDLYAEAVSSFVTCSPLRKELAELKGPPPTAQKIARMLVNAYLSDETLETIDNHCPLYALAADVARAGSKPRAAYTAVLRSVTGVVREAFPAGDREAESKAQLIMSICIGGMVMARTTEDPALRKSLRMAARRHALALLDGAAGG